jgi:ribosomal protein L34E
LHEDPDHRLRNLFERKMPGDEKCGDVGQALGTAQGARPPPLDYNYPLLISSTGLF